MRQVPLFIEVTSRVFQIKELERTNRSRIADWDIEIES